jgi:hypothetical protein
MKYTIRKIKTNKKSLLSRSFSWWVYKGEQKLYGPYFRKYDEVFDSGTPFEEDLEHNLNVIHN